MHIARDQGVAPEAEHRLIEYDVARQLKGFRVHAAHPMNPVTRESSNSASIPSPMLNALRRMVSVGPAISLTQPSRIAFTSLLRRVARLSRRNSRAASTCSGV